MSRSTSSTVMFSYTANCLEETSICKRANPSMRLGSGSLMQLAFSSSRGKGLQRPARQIAADLRKASAYVVGDPDNDLHRANLSFSLKSARTSVTLGVVGPCFSDGNARESVSCAQKCAQDRAIGGARPNSPPRVFNNLDYFQSLGVAPGCPEYGLTIRWS